MQQLQEQNQKQTVCQKIMSPLVNFDDDPAMLSLNYNKVRQYRSSLGGFLSLCYVVVAILIIVFKSVDLLQKNHINVDHIVKKQNDIEDPLNISSSDFMMCFYTNQNSTPQMIRFNQSYEYGIKVQIIQYTIGINEKDEQYAKNVTKMSVSCLDNNKTNKITDAEYYFCMPQTQDLKYTIFGRVDFTRLHNITYAIYQRYSFLITKCNQIIDEGCQKYNNSITLYPFLIMFNNQINPQSINESETILKGQSRRPFQSSKSLEQSQFIKMEFMLKKVVMQTDNSVLPQIAHHLNFTMFGQQITVRKNWHYDEQLIEQFTNPPHPHYLMQINLKRSVYTDIYERSFVTLDTMLSQIFGLLGLLSFLTFGIYKGYNHWGLEQQIRRDLGLPIYRRWICVYYWYKIKKSFYRWFSCCFQKSKAYEEELRSMRIISHKLDASQFNTKYQSIIQSQKQSLRKMGTNSEQSSSIHIHQDFHKQKFNKAKKNPALFGSRSEIVEPLQENKLI